MKIKELLDKVYVTVDLIDLNTDQTIISCTPEYKQKLRDYYEQPVHAIVAHKSRIQIITEDIGYEN